MKITLKQQYMAHPPGTVVDFPKPICDLLVSRGIASVVEEKQQHGYRDKSVKKPAKVKA